MITTKIRDRIKLNYASCVLLWPLLFWPAYCVHAVENEQDGFDILLFYLQSFVSYFLVIPIHTKPPAFLLPNNIRP